MNPGQLAQSHLTTNYGGVAALMIAVYLGVVVYQGRTIPLLNSLKGEAGFIKWMLALIILWVIIQEVGGGLGHSIALVAFLGLALTAGSKVFPQISTYFKGA